MSLGPCEGKISTAVSLAICKGLMAFHNFLLASVEKDTYFMSSHQLLLAVKGILGRGQQKTIQITKEMYVNAEGFC